MHLHHLVPGGFGRLGKGLIQQDAGIVDQNIGAAEILDGVIENRLAASHGRDIGAVGDGAAALGLDRLDHLLGHGLIAAAAVTGTAEIVHDNRRAFARKQFGIGLAEPASRAGDQRDLAVE